MSGILDLSLFSTRLERIANYLSIVGVQGKKPDKGVTGELELVSLALKAKDIMPHKAIAKIDLFLANPCRMDADTRQRGEFVRRALQDSDPELKILGALNRCRITLENAHSGVDKKPLFALLGTHQKRYLDGKVVQPDVVDALVDRVEKLDSEAKAFAKLEQRPLTADVVTTICQYLPIEQAARLAGVCKMWKEGVSNPTLWRGFAEQARGRAFFSSMPQHIPSLYAYQQCVKQNRHLLQAQPYEVKLGDPTTLCSRINPHTFALQANEHYWVIRDTDHFHVLQRSNSTLLMRLSDKHHIVLVDYEIYTYFTKPTGIEITLWDLQTGMAAKTFPYPVSDVAKVHYFDKTLYIWQKDQAMHTFNFEKQQFSQLPAKMPNLPAGECFGSYFFVRKDDGNFLIHDLQHLDEPSRELPDSIGVSILTATKDVVFIQTKSNSIACYDLKTMQLLKCFHFTFGSYTDMNAIASMGKLFVKISLANQVRIYDLLSGSLLRRLEVSIKESYTKPWITDGKFFYGAVSNKSTKSETKVATDVLFDTCIDFE